MKLKNITSSDRQIVDVRGQCILVESDEAKEVNVSSYNEYIFEAVTKNQIEQKEKIKTEKEVN